MCYPSGVWNPVGDLRPSDVKVEQIPATNTSMQFFDLLYTDGLVRQSGSICKCYDEDFEDFLISDEIRKMVFSDESKFYDIYSDEDRREFLFNIFKYLVLGGKINQYEDEILAYVDTTKFFYKDLLSVYQDSETNKVAIGSIVLSVSLWDGQTYLFPGSNHHSFCYFILNAMKREFTVWQHLWEP